MENTQTAADIWKSINGNAGPITADDHAGIFCVGLMMASETTMAAVRDASGLSDNDVERFWRRAENAGIIQADGIHANWSDPVEGGISLLLDSLVIDGKVDRVNADDVSSTDKK